MLTSPSATLNLEGLVQMPLLEVGMNEKALRYIPKTPLKVCRLQKISLLTLEGETIEIDVEEGFFLETDSPNFIYEVKVHRGTINFNGEGIAGI